jgi:hypothetical protein
VTGGIGCLTTGWNQACAASVIGGAVGGAFTGACVGSGVGIFAAAACGAGGAAFNVLTQSLLGQKATPGEAAFNIGLGGLFGAVGAIAKVSAIATNWIKPVLLKHIWGTRQVRHVALQERVHQRRDRQCCHRAS